MDIDGPCFQHAALDHSKASIRLVQILPTLSDRGLVQCQIQHYELHTQDGHNGIDTSISNEPAHLEYSCLSYTWGDGKRTHPITINGKLYLVHQTLWDFLATAREKTKEDGGIVRPRRGTSHYAETMLDPLLWIDAICIDQDNILEKNHQVQQMGRIYSSSKLVLIWLGHNTSEFLREMFKLSDSRWSTRVDPELEAPRWDSHRLYDELDKFKRSSYWARAWITQELVLAYQPVLYASSGVYDLRKALVLIETYLPELEQSRVAEVLMFQGLAVYIRGNDFNTPEECSLHALDRFGATKHCADVRDRVFSVLGLCRTESNLVVDYAVPRQQLMVQVLKSCSHLPCFCAISIISEALELNLDQHAGEKVWLELELPDLPLRSSSAPIWCLYCGRDLPTSWNRLYGETLCIRQVCSRLGGHILAPIQTTAHTGDEESSTNAGSALSKISHCFQKAFGFTAVEVAQYAGTASVSTDLHGVEVSLLQTGAGGSFKKWRLDRKAVIAVVSDNNRDVQTNTRLCGFNEDGYQYTDLYEHGDQYKGVGRRRYVDLQRY